MEQSCLPSLPVLLLGLVLGVMVQKSKGGRGPGTSDWTGLSQHQLGGVSQRPSPGQTQSPPNFVSLNK